MAIAQDEMKREVKKLKEENRNREIDLPPMSSSDEEGDG
jgi:hypothetical protein